MRNILPVCGTAFRRSSTLSVTNTVRRQRQSLFQVSTEVHKKVQTFVNRTGTSAGLELSGVGSRQLYVLYCIAYLFNAIDIIGNGHWTMRNILPVCGTALDEVRR